MPLGLFTHVTYEPAVLAFEPGDKLVLATKGVTESRRGTTEFGAKRIERVLTTDPGMGVIRHVDAGYEEAKEFAAKNNVKVPMEGK